MWENCQPRRVWKWVRMAQLHFLTWGSQSQLFMIESHERWSAKGAKKKFCSKCVDSVFFLHPFEKNVHHTLPHGCIEPHLLHTKKTPTTTIYWEGWSAFLIHNWCFMKMRDDWRNPQGRDSLAILSKIQHKLPATQWLCVRWIFRKGVLCLSG